MASDVRRKVSHARALAAQTAPVVAEFFGLRSPRPMLAPAGSLPERADWEDAGFGAFWVGQATVLLRLGGRTILTDPHFAERAGLKVAGRRVGRRRTTALPVAIEDLPPVDLVLLSHAHMDHWDRWSLRRLVSPSTRAIIPRGTRRLLPRGYGEALEMDWDDEAERDGVALRAVRPEHWGARWLLDRGRGCNAYVLEAGGLRLVFGGDTAETDAFDHLEGDGGVDVAVLGIGNSYEPWHRAHATPEQAAGMAERMGARTVLPMHHSTFHDPGEAPDEPLERLLAVWPEERVICPRIGMSTLEAPAPPGGPGAGALEQGAEERGGVVEEPAQG